MDYINGRWKKAKDTKIGKDVKIHPTAEINVVERLYIGDRTIINAHAKIEGNEVIIGREAWIHEYSWIGGGGCFEKHGFLWVKDFLHLGRFAHINTADAVIIGNEVGIGHQSNIWTHGGYLPVDCGFPYQLGGVTIGNRTWLPHSWVNPGVKIGSNVVVAANSLINKNLPDGCLAAGYPVKIIEANAFPRIDYESDFNLERHIKTFVDFKFIFDFNNRIIKVGDTTFYLSGRVIEGPVTKQSERVKDLLRRNGIRFKFFNDKGMYKEWKDDHYFSWP